MPYTGSQKFRKELEKWEAEGLVSPEQAQKFTERYGLDSPPPWYQRTDFVIKGAALILVGMSLLLVIAQNWEHMGVPFRMALGLVPLAVAYCAVFVYAAKGKKAETELAMFFATLVFGANIFLQAQIFHFSAYFPDGPYWWLVGALPVVLYLNSALLGTAMQIILFTWLSMQINHSQFAWTGIVLMGLFGWHVYKTRMYIPFLAYSVNVAAFLYNLFEALDGFQGRNAGFPGIFLACAAFALLFLAVSSYFVEENESEHSLNISQRLAGILVAGTVFILTFDEAAREMFRGSPALLPAPFLLFAAAWGGEYLIHKRFRQVFLTNAALLGAALALFLASPLRLGDLKLQGTLIAIAFNLVFFGFTVFKIFSGLKERDKGAFISGVFYLMALALARYINFFDDYIVMALGFLACAGFLYWINKHWNRRYAQH